MTRTIRFFAFALVLTALGYSRLSGDTTSVPCQLPPVILTWPVSDGQLASWGLRYTGNFLEAWSSGTDDLVQQSRRMDLYVLSRTTRGRVSSGTWKSILTVTHYTRSPGVSTWRRERKYTIVPESPDGRMVHIERSIVLADADSNGRPELYIAITATTADGGDWDEANLLTNVLADGKRREVIRGTQGIFYTTYGAGSKELGMTSYGGGDAIIEFALCHELMARAVRDFRNEAFRKW